MSKDQFLIGMDYGSRSVRSVPVNAANWHEKASPVHYATCRRDGLFCDPAVEPQHDLPNLPVARVLWKRYPDMKTGCAAWIYADGSHHTAYSQNLTAEHLLDFAEIAGPEFIPIGKNTRPGLFRNELGRNELAYK